MLILEPKEKDLGGFSVRRLLPSIGKKMVGPFVFFDHLGPVDFLPGKGVDVRPHPHIGLATVTYLFEGEIVHRDSLGEVQTIQPGEINLMIAGQGIAHSERTGPELRQQGHTLHALQLWIALPVEEEQCPPSFHHYTSSQLPKVESDGVMIRVLIGNAYGQQSEVLTHSPALYVEVSMQAGETLVVPNHVKERALYLVSGAVQIAERVIEPHQMAVLETVEEVTLTAKERTRLVIVGGDPIGKRTVWWNLVASDKALIEQAKQAWLERRFPAVPGETEFIPLPE